MSKYYIAYGSNIPSNLMADRCPGAKSVGTALLDGWQLLFKKFATIEPHQGKSTPVLVWEITDSDEKRLDRYEGYPSLYCKKDIVVTVNPLNGGEPMEVTAMVYIMTENYPLEMPSRYYYKVLMAGYKEFGFDLQVLAQALADSVGKRKAQSWLKKQRLSAGEVK